MEQDQLFDLLWNNLPLTEMLLAMVATSIITGAVSYFLPEKHLVLKPKIALLVVSLIVSYLVLPVGSGASIKSYIFNLLLVWALSVAFFEYGGGQIILDKVIGYITRKKLVEKSVTPSLPPPPSDNKG